MCQSCFTAFVARARVLAFRLRPTGVGVVLGKRLWSYDKQIWSVESCPPSLRVGVCSRRGHNIHLQRRPGFGWRFVASWQRRTPRYIMQLAETPGACYRHTRRTNVANRLSLRFGEWRTPGGCCRVLVLYPTSICYDRFKRFYCKVVWPVSIGVSRVNEWRNIYGGWTKFSKMFLTWSEFVCTIPVRSWTFS